MTRLVTPHFYAHPVTGQKTLYRRRRTFKKDTLKQISQADIRRLARRGGVKRIIGLVYEETRNALKDYLTETVQAAILSANQADHKTVTVQDVINALRAKQRTTLYF